MTIDLELIFPEPSCRQPYYTKKGPVTEFAGFMGPKSILGIFIRCLQMFKL